MYDNQSFLLSDKYFLVLRGSTPETPIQEQIPPLKGRRQPSGWAYMG